MTCRPSLRNLTFPAALVSFAVAGSVACGGEAFTTEETEGGATGDGDSSGDGDTTVVGDGDSAGDGDASGDGDLGGDGDGSGDGDVAGDGDGDTGCQRNLECILASATCCGVCGVPGIEDVTAIALGGREAHQQELCGDEPVLCPACASAPNPNLFAQCVQGSCEAQDLTEHPDSECSSSDECAVIPAACCECGAGNTLGQVVAINGSRAQGFRESLCAAEGAGGPVACPDCIWEAPTDLRAECVQGRCTLSGEGVPN